MDPNKLKIMEERFGTNHVTVGSFLGMADEMLDVLERIAIAVESIDRKTEEPKPPKPPKKKK